MVAAINETKNSSKWRGMATLINGRQYLRGEEEK